MIGFRRSILSLLGGKYWRMICFGFSDPFTVGVGYEEGCALILFRYKCRVSLVRLTETLILAKEPSPDRK